MDHKNNKQKRGGLIPLVFGGGKMEIPKTEEEVKKEIRECWADWWGNEPSARVIGGTRIKTIGWMLGFNTVDEVKRWADIV